MCAESAPPGGQNINYLIVSAVIEDFSTLPDAGQKNPGNTVGD